MALKVYGSNVCPGTMRFLAILNGVLARLGIPERMGSNH